MMHKTLRSVASLLSITVAALALWAAPARGEDLPEGFASLFDGKTLTGWHGDAKPWSVADGAIVGKTDGKMPANQFLVSDAEYDNFVLRVAFKLHGHKGNSGIQFRSQELKEVDGTPQIPFCVKGNQADIADNQFMGILYGERSRGIMAQVNEEKQKELAKVVKKDDWNTYEITADGAHIVQKINGFTTVDFTDPDFGDPQKAEKTGIIALQLHVGGDMQISFKDLILKKLSK